MKKILYIFLGVMLATVGTVGAVSVLQVQQGGTGAGTLTGCLSGNGTGAITGSGVACGSGSGGGTSQPFDIFPNYNSTTTVLGFKQGSFSLSSTTINGLKLTDLSQGFAFVGSNGLVSTISSSTIKTSWLTNDSGFLTAVTANAPLSGSGTAGSPLVLSTAGTWSGNAGTATALAANGTNCSAGFFPLGVDASGNSETCTSPFDWTINTGYNSTTSTIGFVTGGLFSTASSTFSSNLFLTSLTQGYAYIGSNGKVNTVASSSAAVGTATSLAADGTNCSAGNYPLGVDAQGNVQNCTAAGAGTVTSVVAGAGFQNQGLNITGSGTLVSAFASSSNPALGNIPYATGVGDASNPIKLGFVGTSTCPTFSTGLTYSGTAANCIGGTNGNVTVNTSQNIATLSNLATNGLVTTSGSNGTLGVTVNSTNGLILAMSGGIPTWVATTTFGSGYATTTANFLTHSTTTTAFDGVTFGQNIVPTGGALTFTPTFSGNFNSLSHDTSLTGTTYNLSSAVSDWGLALNHTNTWTVLQSGNYSSSTQYSSFLNASTTNLFAGNITLSTSTVGCLNTNSAGVVYSATCSSGSGTVTSVGLSLPSFFTVTNSPVTTTGTLTGAISQARNSIITTDANGTNLIATGTQLTVGNLLATTSATNHMGTTCNGLGNIGGQGLEVCGSDNTAAGVLVTIQNSNTGVNAYTGLNLLNDLGVSAATNFAGMFLDGNGTNNNTFGTLYNVKNSFGIQNSIGNIIIQASTSASTASTSITFAVGGSALSNEVARITNIGLNIGTTTQYTYPLTVSSSTMPQFSLAAGSGIAQWTFRNAGGTLFLSTTTVAGTATTSTPALSITGSGAPQFWLGTSTGSSIFSINPPGGGDILAIGSTTGTYLRIDLFGHMIFGGAKGSVGVPQISACGTAGTAGLYEGNDTNGIITMGTSASLTSCTLTFAGTYPTIATTTSSTYSRVPVCMVQMATSSLAYNLTASTTQTTLTITASLDMAGKRINYQCFGNGQ